MTQSGRKKIATAREKEKGEKKSDTPWQTTRPRRYFR